MGTSMWLLLIRKVPCKFIMSGNKDNKIMLNCNGIRLIKGSILAEKPLIGHPIIREFVLSGRVKIGMGE